MNLLSRFEQVHLQAKSNRWLRYFTVFCRIALAAGFLPSGFVKIAGERFTSLSVNHPMGHYLEALHETSYYYTFIGIVQVTAAILLLIPPYGYAWSCALFSNHPKHLYPFVGRPL